MWHAAQVNKAVWADVQQWRGWVMCVQQTLPDSLPVLLQVAFPLVVLPFFPDLAGCQPPG